MALKAFITGPYTATYDSTAIGVTQDGFNLSIVMMAELINQTDAYGDSVVDLITRGANCFCSFISRTYDAATMKLLNAHGASTWNVMPDPGYLGSDRAKTLALTDVAGTTAAATGILTGAADGVAALSASKAIMQEGADSNIPLGPTNRDVDVSLRLLPYAYSGSNVFFTAS